MNKLAHIVVSIFLLGFLFSGCAMVESPEEKQKTQDLINKVKNSKITLIDVHHDHCEPCKAIQPIVDELEQEYSSNPDIAFLKYDLSNPFKSAKSMNIAKELGLEKLYKSQRYTGVVLIIDSKTNELLETIVAEHDKNIYLEAIESRIGKKESGT